MFTCNLCPRMCNAKRGDELGFDVILGTELRFPENDNDYLVFGRETKGLPEELLRGNYEKCVRIPMRQEARSLNLSNSVAIVLFEALRQQGFKGLMEEGHLTQSEGGGWVDYV